MLAKTLGVGCLLALLALAALVAARAEQSRSPVAPSGATEREVLGALEAARAAPQEGESYQRVYEAFARLMGDVSQNSLGNVRRLVARINQLVGGPEAQPAPAPSQLASQVAPAKQQEPANSAAVEEKTDQILKRIDQVNRATDQNTLSQLNEDIGRLVATMNDSYLRNIRRLIERVNRVVGTPSGSAGAALHQSADRLDEPGSRQPGFPGWDEFIVAVDRMQKSLAHFVRSSTRLVTSG